MKRVTAKNWRLGDLTRLRSGPPFRERIVHETRGKYGVVQGKDIGTHGTLCLDDMVRLTKVPGKAEPDVLRAGEVVLQTRGSTYRAAIVPRSDIPLLAAGSLYILTPDARHIDPEYLIFFLNLPGTQATLRQLATGSSILNLRRSAVEEIEVPLPSLSDQHRLVELGRLVSKQSEIGERLNQLRLKELHALALNYAKKQGAPSRTKGTRRGQNHD
jgi:hypothetical protein